MRPSEVKNSLRRLTRIQRPAFVWGPIGAGKSDTVAELAEEEGKELRDVRLSLLDSVDLKGFPSANKAKTQMTWLPPDFLPTKGEGILFLDEMNLAPQSVQAAAYQLILNRRLGDYVLPDGWSILAAGNRDSDRSNVNRMPSALSARLVHLDYEIHLDDWCVWATDTKRNIGSNLVSFIRFRPDLLHRFNANERAFPNPRSWVFVDQLSTESGLSPDTEFELVKGTVGEGAAGEYMAFTTLIRDLPTTEQILLDPEGTVMPTSPGTLCALVTSLGMKASQNVMDRMMTYVNRMPVEFQVVFVRDATRRDAKVATTRSFTTWSIANASVLV